MTTFARIVFRFCGLFSSAMSIEDVRGGVGLDRAVETTVEDFFAKRMEVRTPRKADVGSWQIVGEDSRSVFFARPRFSTLSFVLSVDRVVDEVLKVDRGQLRARFPGYATVDGIVVHQQLIAAWSRVRDACGGADWSAVGTPIRLLDGARIETEVHCSAKAVRIELDATTAEIVRIDAAAAR